jgi:hypothetical protein
MSFEILSRQILFEDPLQIVISFSAFLLRSI